MRIEHSIQDGVHRYECWDDYGCSIIASAVVLERGEHIYLRDINVASSYRGNGIGTALLSQILADFEGRHIIADVFEDRVPWYRKHGFEPIGKVKKLIRIARFSNF
jgi:GNAT superfamily N-acetyltransferase